MFTHSQALTTVIEIGADRKSFSRSRGARCYAVVYPFLRVVISMAVNRAFCHRKT